jgi:hypothetical protein
MHHPAQAWLKLLETEGHHPSLTDEGEVAFEHQRRFCFVLFDPQTPRSARLVSPIYWPIESDAALLQALTAASHATARGGAAKVCLLDQPTEDGAVMGAVLEFTDMRPRAIRAALPARLADLLRAVTCYNDEMCAAQERGWSNEHAADEAAADVDSASLVAAGAGELA